MKKLIAVALCAAMLVTLPMSVKADGTGDVNEYGQAYLVTGADLSKDQWNKVIDLLEVSQEDLADYTQLEVTNEEEHKYLDQYLSSSVIGSKAYSSVKLVPKEEGSGLDITTYNINYCTVEMYQNALITAGMKDAEVTVAGPFEISGTAALIGAVKAYADSKGEEVNEEALKTATNELVLTGELGDEVGDSEAASNLVAYVKQKVVEDGLDSDEEIKDAIKEGEEKLGLDLTDEQENEVVDLMQKVRKLDLDPDTLKEQAQSIYNKLSDLGFDIGSVDTNGILTSIQNFFQQILDFFQNLLG